MLNGSSATKELVADIVFKYLPVQAQKYLVFVLVFSLSFFLLSWFSMLFRLFPLAFGHPVLSALYHRPPTYPSILSLYFFLLFFFLLSLSTFPSLSLDSHTFFSHSLLSLFLSSPPSDNQRHHPVIAVVRISNFIIFSLG